MKQIFTRLMAMVFACLFIFQFHAVAQNSSPYWSLAGNSNATSTSKFGTTNAQNLRILTNNIERMRVLANGNIGIGTVTAPNKLTVGGSASFANVVGINGASNNLYALAITATGKSGIIVTGATTSPVLTAAKNGIGSAISITNNTTGSFAPIIYAAASGSADGVQGTTATGYGVRGQSSSSIGVVGTSGSFYGVYGSSTSNYGVYGVTSSGRAAVYGRSDNKLGVLGESVNYTGGWFASTNNNALWAKTSSTTAGVYAGVFEGKVYTFGTYVTSDGNLKQDVKDVTGGLEAIMKLKPKNYQYKHDEKFTAMNLPQGIHYGFIAQELEEVMPWAVEASKHETGPNLPQAATILDGEGRVQPSAAAEDKHEMITIKAINYTEIIPVAVKAIQEQQETISALKETVAAQQKQIDKLNELVSKLTGQPVAISVSSAYLEQNAPNPPKGNNTRIGYFIPENASQSVLVLFDASGKKLKEVRLAQTGHGFITLATHSLDQGTYSYSLLVDGRVADTKKLVIAR